MSIHYWQLGGRIDIVRDYLDVVAVSVLWTSLGLDAVMSKPNSRLLAKTKRELAEFYEA